MIDSDLSLDLESVGGEDTDGANMFREELAGWSHGWRSRRVACRADFRVAKNIFAMSVSSIVGGLLGVWVYLGLCLHLVFGGRCTYCLRFS